MVEVFLDSNTPKPIFDLAIWGIKLCAFALFILAWSGIIGGALRGAGDTYGVMTIFAVFWWFQFLIVYILINLTKLEPDEVLACHIFSSPILLFAMLVRFRSGVWRRFSLAQ
jgi:MATE family multidrug resistance protein